LEEAPLRPEVEKIEAILLVWGVRDEVLEKLPVSGQWLYGEYDFIAKVDFAGEREMEEFEKALRRLINGNTFKLMPVKLSAVKTEREGEETIALLESVKASAP
jgi:DNA-binding Lrp family transcriptional regulator